MEVIKRDGSLEVLCPEKISKCIHWACQGLKVDPQAIIDASGIAFYDGVSTQQMQSLLIKSAAEQVSLDQPDYTYAAARLVLQSVFKEVTDGGVEYPALRTYIERGVTEGAVDYQLLDFDLETIDEAIDTSRDYLFDYQGIQTLYDRYLIRAVPAPDRKKGTVIELPQHFWMRVALGLALNEKSEDRTKYTIEFYNLLSQLKYVCSTPTLFNSGTPRSQMSSCYLGTVPDSLEGIMGAMNDSAQLSKWAGGLGFDWTRVRPSGGYIAGTRGQSSGVVPYLKVYNDISVAVNQGGRRPGAFSAYLEPWHGDIYRFLDLKKQVGEERLRAREIFTALWMNDLFFERLDADGDWSLFSSHDYPELHELHGAEFKAAYEAAEVEGGALRVVKAMDLWKAMLTALSEAGGPWITFKDEMNRRNPQSHLGVIHNSNLCTEIALNTSDDEIAVCNLGSINLAKTRPEEFHRVIPIAMRMLDNVIDLNFYPVEKARNSNMKHRPVGLGLMGWSEYVASQNVDWESEDHLRLTNEVFEQWSYYAIKGSMALSKARGAYSTFEGSKWSQGILPIDTARDLPESWLSAPKMDWETLRAEVVEHGMRNSNVMAIAPTATIGNIAGTTPCIEPSFGHVYTTENYGGTFKVIDPALKHVSPDQLKTAHQIDQRWLIRAAAVRQQWIDQAQSVNLFAKLGIRGRELSDWYRLSWRLGLKTTYYLKNQVNEVDHNVISAGVNANRGITTKKPEDAMSAVACSIENGPNCEACQ